MAAVTSLGVHSPVALPYLVAEGLLPQDPKPDLYQWTTYACPDRRDDDIEEEVLATKHCVVWSQGTVIRHVYRFELEGEDVVQAVLTQFPTAGSARTDCTKNRRKSESKTERALASSAPEAESTGTSGSHRALVVILKTKAHIYFLHGSDHVIDLPFEVAKAFATPRGLLLQRKTAAPPSIPTTPQVPTAPPNSFFSSQMRQSSSYLQSPSLARSFAASQPFKPSPLGGGTRSDTLFQSILGTSTQDAEESVAPLYSLTSPFSDFGVVTFSFRHQRPRVPHKPRPGPTVEFEALDANESIVYASSNDELRDGGRYDQGSLMLLVTCNAEIRTLTVWHAWYIDEQSLANLLKQRAAHKAAKAKRRSSFMSANAVTGTATPAVRAREGTRESFAAAGSVRLPGEATHATATSSRKPTRQEEEDEMAHQMDPDFQPTVSQQNARESRRISSLNADVRASQHYPAASFGPGGGRRNTSFGGAGDRKSFGHRKSRGSTPGSVFARSIGPEDDLMEMDSSFDAENDENVDDIVQHIRATHEAAAADGILGCVDDTFKREFVVRKIHSFAMSFPTSSTEQDAAFTKVVTLKELRPSKHTDVERLSVYIHDRISRNLTCLRLNVKRRELWPEFGDSARVPVPIFVHQTNMAPSSDVVKLTDGNLEALLLPKDGLILSPEVSVPCPIQVQAPYRVYAGVGLDLSAHGDEDVGKNRTMDAPSRDSLKVQHPGVHGRFDEVAGDGVQHRRCLKIRPAGALVRQLLRTCQLVLPNAQAQLVAGTWMLAHANLLQTSDRLGGTDVDIEWVALATTLFVFIGHLVDRKARAALNLSRVATGKDRSRAGSLHIEQHRCNLLQRGPWLWLEGAHKHIQPPVSPNSRLSEKSSKDQFLPIAAELADEMVRSTAWLTSSGTVEITAHEAGTLMLALYVLREEQKLCVLSATSSEMATLATLIAQIGAILGLAEWAVGGSKGIGLEGADEDRWAFVNPSARPLLARMPLMEEPVSVFMWFEHAMQQHSTERYPSLLDVVAMDAAAQVTEAFANAATKLTPRIVALSNMLANTSCFTASPTTIIESMENYGMSTQLLQTLPEAVKAPLQEAFARCEREPPTTWSSRLLKLVGRDDIDTEPSYSGLTSARSSSSGNANAGRDVHTICHALDHQPLNAKTKEASRHAISQLIFSEDRRLVEATSLMHFNSSQVAECPKQPEWNDAQHFEQQRRILQFVTLRMIALPSGDGMLHFESRTPLLTEKYHLSGFSNACLMQPMGHTLTADRSGLTEEKVNWAYFHAGVSAGLRISKSAKGIDTSWIAFNKPSELTNRHAGLLLALGLRGHLRHLAKWLSFKYLTPKHTVTSVGLLIGLSASYMGTMDGLITRMLSVHITRMLPPGAAELNVSPITQTAGLMGIGLLYYNTQHRRMSEIMLSEVEHMELEDPDSGPDPLRDESYRLAAGFALGFINIGKGKDLRGLRGMQLPERLLAIAIGPKPVSAVHVFDRATAGAVMGVTLVYMKSGDVSIARKIDIPDTEAQFDHVRPDILMLRAMAKHIILWDSIVAEESQDGIPSFTQRSLPPCYQDRFQGLGRGLPRLSLKSSDVPFFNIVTGLVMALSLKYAGSGSETARDEILVVLDYLYKAKNGSDASFYYDAKLTRSTIRRCIDIVALAAAMVMAGTGDLRTFRYLRRLHGRTDPETPYGSHLAAHLAIGVLFLGGGTYTFGTSDLAVASLLCAFYPLFPTDVHDNHVHLQAFRHFWVFAVEARCLVIEDIDTQRPLTMPVNVTMKDGSTKQLTSPCLLPELDHIATVATNEPSYWRVTLDFAGNPKHLAHFRETQRILVRRCPPSEAHNSVFTATVAALNDTQLFTQAAAQTWQSIFNLPVFKDIDAAETELILPPNVQSSVYTDELGTRVDDRLALSKATGATDRDALWNLRMLFAWQEKMREVGGGELQWISHEVLETLKARVERRMQAMGVFEQ